MGSQDHRAVADHRLYVPPDGQVFGSAEGGQALRCSRCGQEIDLANGFSAEGDGSARCYPRCGGVWTAPANTPRRAKFVLHRSVLHNALGLPDTVRVVGVHVTHDPDAVHVIIEGDGVPERQEFGGDAGGIAAAGWCESRILAHPAERFRLFFDGWVLGGPVSEMRLRVAPTDGGEA